MCDENSNVSSDANSKAAEMSEEYICSICNVLCTGEAHAIIDKKCYCEMCLEDMPMCLLVPLFGGEWKERDDG